MVPLVVPVVAASATDVVRELGVVVTTALVEGDAGGLEVMRECLDGGFDRNVELVGDLVARPVLLESLDDRSDLDVGTDDRRWGGAVVDGWEIRGVFRNRILTDEPTAAAKDRRVDVLGLAERVEITHLTVRTRLHLDLGGITAPTSHTVNEAQAPLEAACRWSVSRSRAAPGPVAENAL